MPRITIRDGAGEEYRIDSSNPAVVAAWLVEIIGNLVSANTVVNHPIFVDAWPRVVYDKKTGRMEADWLPGQANAFKWDADQMRKLLDLLEGIPDGPQPQSPQFREKGWPLDA